MPDDQKENEEMRKAAHEISKKSPPQELIERNSHGKELSSDTGKEFLEWVEKEMELAPDKRICAKNIADNLSDRDLGSKAMRTPEGLEALGILRHELSQTIGFFDKITEKITGENAIYRDLYNRIAQAYTILFQSLYPEIFGDVMDLQHRIEKNLDKFLEEFKQQIAKEKQGWFAINCYCRLADFRRSDISRLTGRAVEVRAVIERWVPADGYEGGKKLERKDVCIGGVNQRGTFETPQQIGTRSEGIESVDPVLDCIFIFDGMKSVVGIAKWATDIILKGVTKEVAKVAGEGLVLTGKDAVKGGIPSSEKVIGKDLVKRTITAEGGAVEEGKLSAKTMEEVAPKLKIPRPTASVMSDSVHVKEMQKVLDTIDVSKPGKKWIDPRTNIERQHLWGDPEHCQDFLKAMGEPNKYDEILRIADSYAQHRKYNEYIVSKMQSALSKPDTFMYECDYYSLKGERLGRQVNVEFTASDGKTRILVSFDKKDGQLLNTFDILKSGTPLGKGDLRVMHPEFSFRNRTWISPHNDAQWLKNRGETPLSPSQAPTEHDLRASIERKGRNEQLSITKPLFSDETVKTLGPELMKRFDTIGVDERLLKEFESCGMMPKDVSSFIDKFAKNGLSSSEIKKELYVEKGLREIYRDTYCGKGPDKVELLRGALKANNNDIRIALYNRDWFERSEKWNKYKPHEFPPFERFNEETHSDMQKLEQTIRKKISPDSPGGGPPFSIREQQDSSIQKDIQKRTERERIG